VILKNHQKKNSTRNQKSTRVQICFFMNFKGKKKTLNMNSHNQMKHFDTNIIHFSSLNRCQRHVSLFTAGIRQPLSFSFLNQGPKNNENKLLYQTKIEKILRNPNYIICMIF
jgi:hypothetical protein